MMTITDTFDLIGAVITWTAGTLLAFIGARFVYLELRYHHRRREWREEMNRIRGHEY